MTMMQGVILRACETGGLSSVLLVLHLYNSMGDPKELSEFNTCVLRWSLLLRRHC